MDERGEQGQQSQRTMLSEASVKSSLSLQEKCNGGKKIQFLLSILLFAVNPTGPRVSESVSVCLDMDNVHLEHQIMDEV